MGPILSLNGPSDQPGTLQCGAAMRIGPILSALQIATLSWSFDTS
jgi:hypothetical protein